MKIKKNVLVKSYERKNGGIFKAPKLLSLSNWSKQIQNENQLIKTEVIRENVADFFKKREMNLLYEKIKYLAAYKEYGGRNYQNIQQVYVLTIEDIEVKKDTN